MSWWDDEIGELPEAPEDALVLAGYLESIALVRRFYFFDEIDSTSRWLMRFVESAGSLQGVDGTLAVADYQTAGKGRNERSWLAPRGKAILMSLVLAAPPESVFVNRVDQIQFVMMAGPVSTAEAIREATGLEATIKYPNDVVIHGHKCAGILVERSPKFPDAYVIGIGINVNQRSHELPDAAPVKPTSIAEQVGREVDRWALLATVLRRLESWWKSRSLDHLTKKMNELCTTIGRHVRIMLPNERVEGVALGVSSENGLLVRTDSGLIRQILSGDIIELRTDEIDHPTDPSAERRD